MTDADVVVVVDKGAVKKGRGLTWEPDENLRAVKAGAHVSADPITGADNTLATLNKKVPSLLNVTPRLPLFFLHNTAFSLVFRFC